MAYLNKFQENLENDVIKICKQIKPNSELEVSFTTSPLKSYSEHNEQYIDKRSITLKKYNNLLKFLNIKAKSEELKLETIISLDILYNYNQKIYNTYRISINNLNNINNFIQDNYLLSNHIIFIKQVNNYINNINNISLINKIRSQNDQILLNEYAIKIRLSQENILEQNELNKILNLDEIEKHNIFYRYKQRVSLILENNEYYNMSIDLTDVKTSSNLINLINDKNIISKDKVSNYELEIDVSFKKKPTDKIITELLTKLGNLMYMLEQFLQESYLLISRSETLHVIKELNKLCYDDKSSDTSQLFDDSINSTDKKSTRLEIFKDIPIMQSISMEIYHLVDTLHCNYSISDKADGDRYFLMIYNNNIYLISTILEVKKIKENYISNYNLTILDGEYVYIPIHKKFIFLAFDILFKKGEDIRNKELLQDRLEDLRDVLSNVFKINLISSIYTNNYNIDDIYKFNRENIKNHLTTLNKLLAKNNGKDNNIIYGKYIIFPMVASLNNDIYKLSVLIWESYTKNTEFNCPYILDGLIYTPIVQKYTKNMKNIKYKILKWKPENKNSIDFYILFERDENTNKILSVYDRTSNNNNNNKETITNQELEDSENLSDITNNQDSTAVYQILNLYVGSVKNNKEIPILFKKDQELYQACIYIKDNYPRDIEGNIIQDNTVVEFIFDTKSTKDNKFRWIPLRTRYDKTEFVYKYKRKYGNNSEIANRIWNSILNPVRYEDIKLLSNDITYTKHIKELKSNITSETIALARRDDTYFQIITNLAKPLRSFHNWIKSNMMYMYCSEKILPNNKKIKMDILDIGVGKAQDLLKLYHAHINYAVGIDINEAGIYSGSDGAISRYNAFKKKMPHFPKITFMVADAGQRLDYTNQLKTNLVNNNNTNLLKQIFGIDDKSKNHHKFDIINAQFMIHYLLKDKITWNNFCHNINKYLKKDGYILITTFDGNEVHNKFINNHINRTVLLDNGESKLLFDIVKKYSNTIELNKIKNYDEYLGLSIDVHMPTFMDEGIYQTEYLVYPNFLIKELKNKCNLKLVETELFGNLYYLYEDFFKNIAIYESKLETRKFFIDVKSYYNINNSETMHWLEYTKLNRYYIFQKISD